MPYARKSKVTKRTIKRKPKVYKRKVQTSRPSGPFKSINSSDPFRSQMSIKFHYSQQHLMSSGLGGACGTEQVYRLNSLHDPELTGAGHQPYGYDQVANLYRKYKVNAVKVILTYTDPSTDGMRVCCQFQPSNGVYTLTGKSPSELNEQPMSITRAINNTGSQKGTVSQFFPMHSVSGLTALQFKADVDLLLVQQLERHRLFQ